MRCRSTDRETQYQTVNIFSVFGNHRWPAAVGMVVVGGFSTPTSSVRTPSSSSSKMAIAYLVHWTCVRRVCFFVKFLFFQATHFPYGIRTLITNYYCCKLGLLVVTGCSFGDSRWCFPAHRVCRITSNVVVAIHCASSPWNGRSIKRQVLLHIVLYLRADVVFLWKRKPSVHVFRPHTPSRLPWTLGALYIFFV